VYSWLMRIAGRSLLILIAIFLLGSAAVSGLFFLAPHENANLPKVDTLIVLGCPTRRDGSPTPEQRERVLEGVREFNRGSSNHIIMTGGAAHNRFVEAHAMAVLAEANGVPPSAVIEEEQALDTIQNIYYSEKIMEANRWHTVEVISSPYHLPRTALILRHHPALQWKTHAAPWPPEYGLWKKLELDWKGALDSVRFHIRSLWPSQYLPG
jgi:uncharacterized SAM-binding protein YcdF (DUF218 family)